MGKKSKRNRSGGGGGGNTTNNNGNKNINNNKTQKGPSNNNNKSSIEDIDILNEDLDVGRHRTAPALRTPQLDDIETKDNLKFEDPYVEEYIIDDDDEEDDEEEEEEEEIVDDDGWEDDDDDQDVKMATSKNKNKNGNDNNNHEEIIQTWNPLSNTEEPLDANQLEINPTAYKMYHAFSNEWPSLSFDFIRDDYGECRMKFPHKCIAAIGTQASQSDKNNLTIIQISDLSKIKNDEDNDDDILGEEINKDDDNDDDDDDDKSNDDSSIDSDIELDPIMEHYSIKHHGGINRIRVMPQRSNIVATWSDTGTVNLYNIETILQRFQMNTADKQKQNSFHKLKDIPKKPFFTYNKHNDEGYAMDWSKKTIGSLVTGACNGTIALWKPRPEGGYEVSSFYKNEKLKGQKQIGSIEDLQWSPTEDTVFASSEMYGYIRIFDTRASNRAMITNQIHNNIDVNVLSWNPLVSNLLATGSDDGCLSVWDLRHFSPTSTSASSSTNDTNAPKPLARFTSHKTPIASVEWHPTDESMLACTDDIGTYIYDLSVEEDETTANNNNNNIDIPPQLLFVHSGSELFKEVHWHPQISSCLMTTSLSGFSVFIPSNL